jgi:hypothetical protein
MIKIDRTFLHRPGNAASLSNICAASAVGGGLSAPELNCLRWLLAMAGWIRPKCPPGVRIVSLSAPNKRSLVPEPLPEVGHERQYFQ